MPIPQSKSSQYADEVIAFNTPEFRLHQIIKALEQSLKSRPNDSGVLILLGMALYRVGRLDAGINKMKYSVHLNPNKVSVGNLAISLTSNGKYEEAWDALTKYGMEISLFDAALCGHYENIKSISDESFQDSLTKVSRLVLKLTPYGSSYEVELDEEDGQKVVDIKATIPASVESVFNMYNELTKAMSKKFSSDVLMRVIPRFASSL